MSTQVRKEAIVAKKVVGGAKKAAVQVKAIEFEESQRVTPAQVRRFSRLALQPDWTIRRVVEVCD